MEYRWWWSEGGCGNERWRLTVVIAMDGLRLTEDVAVDLLRSVVYVYIMSL